MTAARSDALHQYCVPGTCSIREMIRQIDATRRGIALVVDPQGRLLGTVTDGDVRRAILANVDLAQPVQVLLARKAGTRYATPITAPADLEPAAYLQVMQAHDIVHLPVVDAAGRVTGLVTLDDFLAGPARPIRAVVMAGGRGQRLHPLTEEVPKPMLQVGDRPLLEIILGQLRDAGITQVQVTTHHKPEKISAHFGDGRDFGVQLSYVTEHRPLGTVGGLGLLEPPTETTLVMNGDILTQLDFRAMLAYHRENQADLTVAVRQYDVQVPYGVVECEGPRVRRVTEKPLLNFFVNAGIYLLEPMAYQRIPGGQRFDMTELIDRLLQEGRVVASFPIREYWLDIGQHDDYVRAQEQAKTWPWADPRPASASGGPVS